MKFSVAVVLVVMALLPSSLGFACSTNMDCNLNGVCKDRACECVPMWSGGAPDCSLMSLLPASSTCMGGAYGYCPNVTSWGGIPVLLESTYHLFVTEMSPGCHLDEWGKASTVTHATASTPAGPFTKVATALLPEAHNPHAVKLPDGRLALFHIGSATNSSYPACTGDDAQEAKDWIDGSVAEPLSSGLVHVSSSPNGPWEAIPLGFGCNNPAPMVHPNGTLYLVCTWSLHRADNITGPWAQIATFPGYPAGSGTWEDPFLYLEPLTSSWHVIAHSWNHSSDPTISGHYYSPDGLTWTASLRQPYGNTAELEDGTVVHFRTRERPKVLFNSAGVPTHLYNGVNTNKWCPSPASRCKVAPGYDWDYTFVQPIQTSAQ